MSFSWYFWLVILSVLLVLIGSFTALTHAKKMPKKPAAWICAGGITPLILILVLHFVGMLAFHLLIATTLFTLLWFSSGLLTTRFEPRTSRQNALAKLEQAHRDLQLSATQQAAEMTNSLRESEAQLRMTLRCAPDAVFICQVDGCIDYLNDHVTDILGYTQADLCRKNIFTLAPPAQVEAYKQTAREILQDHERRVLEVNLLHKNGMTIPMELNTVLLPDGRVYASCRDIRERKAAQRTLQEYQEKLQSLLNSMAEGMYGMDTLGICTFVNPAFLSLLGYSHHREVVGQKIHQLIHYAYPDGSPYPSKQCQIYLAYQAMQKIHVDDEVFWHKDGHSIPVEYWAHPIIKEGLVVGSVVTFLDITKRLRTEQNLRQSEAAALTALQELNYQKYALDQHAIVAIADVRGSISYVNQKFCTLTGYSQTELLGQNHRLLNSGCHPKSFFQEMYRTIAKGDVWSGEICNRSKAGALYWVITTIVPYLNEHGKPTQYIAIRTDITERKAAEDRIHQLAFYDALTNLPNRRLLLDRLQQAIATSQRTARYGAVLFLDLDKFKTLNDSQGHDVGDLLLSQVAHRLQNCVNIGDSVARLGGDEFVMILETLDHHLEKAANQAEQVAERIREALNQPFQLKGLIQHTTPSIGITLFQGSQFNVDDLLKHADIAMYQSKAAGRNTFHFYEPAMQIALNARTTLERELRQALSLQQFRLYYQVQIDHEGRTLGAEALLRWQHPLRGLITPDEFIPVLEETELIIPIGLWVLHTACLQLKNWQAQPLTDALVIAVNISAKQFHQADFVMQIQKLLHDTGAQPCRLKLELTESMVLEDVNVVIAKMHELKALGIRFSMDDFGTGYSSLQYLKRLPLDQIKIDQSFVRDITTDPNDAAIVQAIIAIAQALDLDVIAEGVETLAQENFLNQHGCEHFQGYLFGKAMPSIDFEAALQKTPIAPRGTASLNSPPFSI